MRMYFKLLSIGSWSTVTRFGKPPTMCAKIKLENNGGGRSDVLQIIKTKCALKI